MTPRREPPGARWSPRYLAYVRAQGVPDPHAMLRIDRRRWPGGAMAGFMLWISERWREWRAERGLDQRDMDFLSDADHADFTAWLEARWPLEPGGTA